MKSKLPWIIATVLLAAVVHVIAIKEYPSYVMYRLAKTSHNPPNTILHEPPVTDKARRVVRPSPDLIYSICQFDLSDGPLKIFADVPADTYWSVSMFADNTDNFYVINDKQLGKPHAEFVLGREGADYQVPQGAIDARSPTTRGAVLFRMLVTEPSRMDEIIAVQKKAGCEPL